MTGVIPQSLQLQAQVTLSSLDDVTSRESARIRMRIVYQRVPAGSGGGRVQFQCDGTRAETTFRLSAKRTCPFKSAGGRQFSRLPAAEVCASAVVMLDTPCSEVV